LGQKPNDNSARTSTNDIGWTLVPDSAELHPPLNRFLKLRSDTVHLLRINEFDSDNIFAECVIPFRVIRKIGVKKIEKRIKEVGNSLPTRVDAATNKNTMEALYRQQALLEITLLDSSRQEIPGLVIISTQIDSIMNLAAGNGNISFSFRTDGTEEPLKRITVGKPRYYRMRLSDRGIGLSKVFADYMRASGQ